MDARAIIGFLIFMGIIGLIKWFVIDAIWKANVSCDSKMFSPQDDCQRRVGIEEEQ